MYKMIVKATDFPMIWFTTLTLALILPSTMSFAQAQFITKITAPDGEPGDFFGGYTRFGSSGAVAIFGDTAIVGAAGTNEFGGAAYIFDRHEGGPNNWGLVKELLAHDNETADWFGYSVAIYDDLAVVGSPGNANLDGRLFDGFGAAYVFARDQGGADHWGEVAKLLASDADRGDAVGSDVAILSDTVVIGAIAQKNNTGAAYVFSQNQGGLDNWAKRQS